MTSPSSNSHSQPRQRLSARQRQGSQDFRNSNSSFCARERANSILDSLDFASLNHSLSSREQLVARFGRLHRTAERSLAVLDTASSEDIEPSVLENFKRDSRRWLAQAKASFPFDVPQTPHLPIELRSPIQLSQILQRLHELWQTIKDPKQDDPETPPAGPASSSDSLVSSDSESKELPRPPLLSFTEGQWMFTGSSKTLSDLGHLASDVAQELKDILSQEAGLLAHEAQLFRDAVTAGSQRLLNYSELPSGWRNNHFIQTGYRFVPATRERLAGLIAGGFFGWHNELLNIWTHTLGLCFIIYLIAADLPYHASESFADWLVAASFLLSAAVCLLLSVTWHIFAGCATWRLFNSTACLDYCGVSLLITTSVFTSIWYGFYCEPQYVQLYGTMVIATGVLGVFLPFAEWFNRRENKNWRIAFFLSMCGTAVGPQIHMMATQGVKDTIGFFSGALASASAYVVGLLFYGFNVPEVFRPGSFVDYVAHSHQFWHCAIVVAIWLQWTALKVMHEGGPTSFSCGAKEHTLLGELSQYLHHN